MRETFVQRVGRGADNIARRVEIRFTDLEVNNIAPLRLQRARFYQYFKRCLSAQPRHPPGETKFALGGLMHVADYSALAQFVLLAALKAHGGAFSCRESAAPLIMIETTAIL